MEFRFFYCPQIPEDLAYLEDNLYIYDKSGKQLCDFMALILDRTNPEDVKIIGTTKARLYDSETSRYILKEISPNLPRNDKPVLDELVVYIQEVNIYDSFKGKGLCKELLKFLMDNVTKTHPSIRFFKITNTSERLDGISTCKCYVKSGHERKYDVYFDTLKNHWLWGNYIEMNEMSNEKCLDGKDMPRDYMYVKPKKRGGINKKNKTWRRKSKKRINKTKKLNGRRS